MKDSAGYGSVTITRAITINAGMTDIVVLRGLTVEGAVIGCSSALGNGQFGLAAVLSGSNLFSFRNNQFFNNGSGSTGGTIGTATLQ